MATALPVFPSFDPSPDAGAPGPRWDKYINRFKNLIIALDIKNAERQKALLLHYIGEDMDDVFDTLTIGEPAEGENVFDAALNAITAYLTPKRNIAYEEYIFRQAIQEKGETIMAYCTRLKQLAKTCEFADTDREIKSQIIQNCRSTKLRRKALTNSTITLDALLDQGKTMELTDSQAANLEKQPREEVKRVSSTTRGKPSRNNRNGRWNSGEGTRDRNASSSQKCRNCGGSYPHEGGKTGCPAFGKECRNCGKLNHFKTVCKSEAKPSGSRPPKPSGSRPPKPSGHRRDVRNLSDSSDDEEYNIFRINTHKSRHDEAKHPVFNVKVNGTWLRVIADSGSSINILDEAQYRKLRQTPALQDARVKIYPYNSDSPLPVLGKFVASIEAENATQDECTFYVIKGTGGSLLSWRTSQNLDLIKVIRPLASTTSNTQVDELVQEYQDLFSGLGKLKDFQVKLHIDESIPPVAQPHRRVPFHVREQLEEQLRKDEELGVIERIEGPTPWVSPVVVAPKPKQPGKIRVCVDMRQANQAVKRERHLTPTIKEMIGDLNGAKVFSKLDLNQGYNQLELAPESRYITTFSTHLGLMRFKRLNFGISSAAEIFQNVIRETLAGIPGAYNISDDILIAGIDQADHNRILRAVFQRLREKCLTLNEGKCVFNKSELEFFGYIFSSKGLSADPKKIDDILKLDAPANASEVRSLLGMANYSSRFIPGYATLTAPLRELTRKDNPWKWTERHDSALAQLKEALASAPVTSYFDPDKETEVVVDASPVGLGAILAQVDPESSDRHIVSYASRSLTETEQRYSQTEREALAVVWACEHLHLYIYGKPVTVYTDHKPLVAIYGNPASQPPARIQRWALRLQPYQLTIKYRPGEGNPADYMSRHPAKYTPTHSRQEKVAEEFVDYITATATPKALQLQDIEAATRQDPTLRAVSEALCTDNWSKAAKDPAIDTPTYRALEKVRSELTVGLTSHVILRGNRIVVPAKLQQVVVDLAHEGHQGIVKTKALLREKVWFAGINKMTEERVKSCLACQVATPERKQEPLNMSPLPQLPWQEVSIDFKEVSSGEYLLVVTDDYSRYPIVEVVHTTAAKVVIPRLNKIFSEFGIPEVVRTDNGPPYSSKEFREFADSLGFKHRKVTPLWPRANGEVERFMRTIKKAINTAKTEDRPWKDELCKLLRNYRATPHSTTGKAPATAMFNRQIRTKLPELPNTNVDPAAIRQQDEEAKRRMKAYADKKAYVKPSHITEGDVVIVKRDPSYKKSATPYDPKPYIVTQRKGSMITAARGDKAVTRNSSFFKPVKENVPTAMEEEQEEEEEADTIPFEQPIDEGNNNPTPIQQQGESMQSVQQPVQPVNETARRYPQRTTRRPPSYLADYVSKS